MSVVCAWTKKEMQQQPTSAVVPDFFIDGGDAFDAVVDAGLPPLPPRSAAAPTDAEPPQLGGGGGSGHHREADNNRVSGGGEIFVPYRYTTNPTAGVFRIYARSEDGRTRRVFNIDVCPWSYLLLKVAPGEDPNVVCTTLRHELATERVSFDAHTTGAFIIEPTSRITKRVADACSGIVNVPLAPYTVLNRYQHRFFDVVQADGSWVDRTTTAAASSSSSSGGGEAAASRKAAFQTIAWSQIDAGTVAFTRGVSETAAYVWTTHASFAMDAHSIRDAVSDLGVSVAVRTFASVSDMTAAFVRELVSNTDIAAHYGEPSHPGTIIAAVVASFKSPAECPLEIFDVRDFVSALYPEMPSHDFRSVVRDVDLMPPPPTTESGGGGGGDDSVVAAIASMSANHDVDDDAPLIPDMRTTVHSPENVAFCLEKIAARALLLARLFSVMIKSAAALCYNTGCNLGELTRPEVAARGVVTMVNPIAAQATLHSPIQQDEIEPGVHSTTYVTPYAHVLADLLRESADATTAAVAVRADNLRSYWWVIRDIYALQSLKPPTPPDVEGSIGMYLGMVYSTAPILSPTTGEEYPPAKVWNGLIGVGSNSWISVTLPQKSGGGGIAATTTTARFGYAGLADVCRHQFPAVRSAVEMFLTLLIANHSAPTTASIAATTSLTPENMAIKQRVTQSNIACFRRLLLESEANEIEAGRRETVLRLWYRGPQTFTTNSIIADRRIYTAVIEKLIARAFGNIQFVVAANTAKPPPPQNHPPPPQREEDRSGGRLGSGGATAADDDDDGDELNVGMFDTTTTTAGAAASSVVERQQLHPPPPPQSSSSDLAANHHRHRRGFAAAAETHQQSPPEQCAVQAFARDSIFGH